MSGYSKARAEVKPEAPAPTVMAAIDRYFTFSNAYFGMPQEHRAPEKRYRYIELALAIADFPVEDFGSDPLFIALRKYFAIYDIDDDDAGSVVFEAVPTTLAGIATKLRWWSGTTEAIPNEFMETLLLALKAQENRSPDVFNGKEEVKMEAAE